MENCAEGALSRHFLFHSGDPSEVLRPKPQPREKQPMQALSGPIWVPGGQTPEQGSHPRHPHSQTPARPLSGQVPESPQRR